MATETRTHTQTEEPTAARAQAQAHPPPPSPPTSPPAQSTSNTQYTSNSNDNNRGQPRPGDGRSFYPYLFNKDKTPTALLDSLLRAIGKYIETEIGDKNHQILDKSKLAAFYKAVGGDYDSLFVNAPDKSISYIWQALGVQHTLQPTANDFEEPSIPALTLKGFVRWQSLQILLGPEEHVPFIQFAVRNWGLKHPDTGEPFPTDLPSTSFPAVCDPQIDQWHKDCAKRLRNDVASTSTPVTERPGPTTGSAGVGSDPRVHVHFTHVHPGGASRHGPAMDYFERRPNVPFVHVPGRAGTHHSQSIHKRRVDSSSSSSVDERARRRRSFSDYPSPQHEKVRPLSHVDQRRPDPVRRHSSQPKHHHLSPSSDSESDEAPPSPRSRIHRTSRPPRASVRVFPPAESPISPPMPQGPARQSHRAELRQDDSRRRSLPPGHFGIRQKVMSFLPGSNDRQRSSSRSDRDNDSRPNSARQRTEHQPSRLSRPHSDDVYSSEESGSDASQKHRNHREREREREREKERTRGREKREREIEEERERRSRKDHVHLRPAVQRRTSSAADVERRTREWDVRDRYREREIDHGRDPRDPRGNLTGDERQRRSWRERERERERDRGGSPTVVGVGGRKYPSDKSAWA